MKILLVDDNNVLRGILRDMLELEKSFAVIEAINGYEALKILLEVKVDLIISDYIMIGMDGIMLLKKIRSNPALEKIPFIMATGYSEDDVILEIKSAGAVFLQKPLSKETLFEAINEITTKI